MELSEALQIVLDLALQNVIDERDDAEEYQRQLKACQTVEDFVENMKYDSNNSK